MNKKGLGLNALAGATLTIVMIGVLLGLGLYVLMETQQGLTTTNTVSTNETIAVTTAGTAVSTATQCGFNTFAVVTVLNGSTEFYEVGAGNYTVSADAGTIQNITADDNVCANAGECTWNITYTYRASDDGDTTVNNACDSLTNTSDGLGGLANWIAIIVVVMAAAIVLGVVLSSFGGRRPGI